MKTSLPTPTSQATTAKSNSRVFDPTASPAKSTTTNTRPDKKPPFRVRTLGELRKKEVPEHLNLVGNFHLHKGAFTTLVGGWGLGKSFAALWLACMGAVGSGNWLGYEVRRQFKTLIIQTENSTLRLIIDSKRLVLPEEFDESVKIIDFEMGRADLTDKEVFESLQRLIREDGFDLVIVDPWNAFTEDNNEKDVKAAIRRIMQLCTGIPNDEVPGFLVLTHTRKTRAEDNHQGRQNAEKAAGSYVLLSNSRCIINYDPYSNDPNDKRVVVYCTKKSLGKDMGGVTAWEQVDGGFAEIDGFDFDEWQESAKTKGKESRAAMQLWHAQEATKDGPITRKELGKRLMNLARVTDSTVSDYLKKDGGKWFHMFTITGGLLWDLKAEFKPVHAVETEADDTHHDDETNHRRDNANQKQCKKQPTSGSERFERHFEY